MTTDAHPSSEDVERLLRSGLFIGGDWVTDYPGEPYEHHNPATGRHQQTIRLAGAGEVESAVASARAAFDEWRAFPADGRRDALLRLAGLLQQHSDSLGTTATLELGVPKSMADLLAGSGPAGWFSYYAGWADKITGGTLSPLGYGGFDYTLAEPFGVVAAIIPWNGPLTTLGMKVAPALAAGNCVVVKPPELAPFTSLRFAELAVEAGIPPGVVNVVVGGAAAGDALVRHPGVDKVSFTGGTETARMILAATAESLTPSVMELGGKSANLVFEDSVPAEVVPNAVFTAALLSGQVCTCPSRLLVHESHYDEAVALAEATAGTISMGDPFQPTTMMGPVINAAHRDRVEAAIADARQHGAGRLICGGERPGGDLADGYYVRPAIFADVDNASRLAQQEIFGPVLAISRFADEDEAVALANGTKYGLAGFVWTNDLGRAHRVAARLRAGTVSVNSMIGYLAPNTPYGGTGASGFGREGGKEGLLEFLRTKNVYVPSARW